MKRLLAALAVSPLLAAALVASTATSAHAVPCTVTLNEFQSVDNGMTREHVQNDIFDGYKGWQHSYDAGVDGWDYLWRAYTHNEANPAWDATITYRAPHSDPSAPMKVYGKAWNSLVYHGPTC